jgi:proton-translocating NADH-quinone oxidoreductase chain N
MPSLFILIPLFGVIILNLLIGRMRERLAFWFAFGLFILQIIIAIYHYPIFWGKELEKIDAFFKVSFYIDHLDFVMFLCIGIVSLASLIVARYTIFEKKELFKLINLLIIASIGMCGVVLVRDLFSLYIFLEITAVTSFILIASPKNVDALEGAFKYLMLSGIATVLLLSSIAFFMISAGNASYHAINTVVADAGRNPVILFAIALLVCGLFIKGGLVPFHAWLPDAYTSAPAPVSVLLAGIVTKVAGIYTIIRVAVSVIGLSESLKNVLLALGLVSILVGAFAAMGQKDFKRMLAYSSISQVGYIIVGFGTGTVLGAIGAVFHLFNHAIFKSLLFVNSAAVESKLGTNNMEHMGGLSNRMPITGATSVLGFLSASGVPPLAGFWSKLIIVIALWTSDHQYYAAAAVLAGILTLSYFLSMQRKVFFGKLADGLSYVKEANAGLSFTAVVLAAITVFVGLFFPLVFINVMAPIKDILIK